MSRRVSTILIDALLTSFLITSTTGRVRISTDKNNLEEGFSLINLCEESSKVNIRNESTIYGKSIAEIDLYLSRNANYFGLKPIEQSVELDILEQSFNSNSTLKFEAKQAMQRIYIDFSVLSFGSVTFKLALKRVVSGNEQICIKRIDYYEEFRTVIFDLKGTIEEGEIGLLEARAIKGGLMAPSDVLSLPADTCMVKAHSDDDGWQLFNFCIMHEVRTIFACVDHPNVKTMYNIAIRHPPDTLAEATGELLEQSDDGLTRFKQTQSLSADMILFSIMKGYRRQVLTNNLLDSNIQLSVYWHKKRSASVIDKMETIFKAITPFTLEYMQNVTGYKYDVDRLVLVPVKGLRIEGGASRGLLLLNDVFDSVVDDNRIEKIVHELVHNWIGVAFFITNFEDICLIEGLTDYAMKRVMAAMRNVPLDSLMYSYRDSVLCSNAEKSEPMRNNYTSSTNWQACYYLGPMVFHMIAKHTGEQSWNGFLRRILVEKQLQNVDFDYFLNTLGALDSDQTTANIFADWFSIGGISVLYVSVENNQLILRQSIGRTSRYEINTSIGPLAPVVLSSSENFSVSLSNEIPEWIWIDQNAASPVAKLYTVDLYQGLIGLFNRTIYNETDVVTTEQQWMAVVTDMCCKLLYSEMYSSKTVAALAQLWDGIHGEIVKHNRPGEGFGYRVVQEISATTAATYSVELNSIWCGFTSVGRRFPVPFPHDTISPVTPALT